MKKLKEKKLLAIVISFFLVGATVLGVHTITAQSPEELATSSAAQTASSSSTSASNMAYEQIQTERALRKAYLDAFDRYTSAETAFNDLKTRYQRFQDQSLWPDMISRGKSLYQARDEMLIAYLNWLENSVNTNAEEGSEIVESTLAPQTIISLDPFATASESPATIDLAPLNKQPITISQKQGFLRDITNLKTDLQQHYQAAEMINGQETWEDFKALPDPRAEFDQYLYPIFAFTTLSQLRELNAKLSDVLTELTPVIIEASPNEVVKVEQTKILNQLAAVEREMSNEVSALENSWTRVNSLNSYQDFTQKVQRLTTQMTQITQTLLSLYK